MKKLFFILILGVFSVTGLYAQKIKNVPFKHLDQVPGFPGGDKAMFEFLGNNLKYPKEAVQKKIQGKVLIELVIDEDGGIRETHILEGLGFGCDEEVTRVVKAMPNWTPGVIGNEVVRSSFVLPVMFSLGAKTSK